MHTQRQIQANPNRDAEASKPGRRPKPSLSRKMRRALALCSFFSLLAQPICFGKGFVLEKISVEQLERQLAACRGLSDSEISKRLSHQQLTERLSTQALVRWQAEMPGDKSRQALMALADVSAFLDPPAAEIPQGIRPSLGMQSRMMSMAVTYVARTLHRLPDFLATRYVSNFQDAYQVQGASGPISINDPHLRIVDTANSTVQYREGREVVESEAAVHGNTAKPLPEESGNWGVFGPLLRSAMLDAGSGKVLWSRWENGPSGRLAVFRYLVPEELSHYEVNYCCLVSGSGSIRPLHLTPAYHGELAVDPETGAIMRLVVKTDLAADLPIVRADVLVEYGQVDIGGKSYVCPVKSVSISKGRAWEEKTIGLFATRLGKRSQEGLSDGAANYSDPGMKVTTLSDAVFDKYHQYRGEMQLVSGDVAAESASAPAAPANPQPSSQPDPQP